VDNTHGLDQECCLYTSYLINWGADKYVCEKYHEAHALSSGLREGNKKLDSLLVAISLKHGFLTKLVDVYTRIVYPTSLVRKKWILLLAILESYGPSHLYFENADNDGRGKLYLRVAGKGLKFIVLLVISMVALMPVHAACAVQEICFMRRA